MQQRIIHTFFLVSAVLLLAVAGAAFSSPPKAEATDLNPALQQVLDTQICPALQKIKGQKLYSNCKDYTKQSDLDKAEKNICSKYGKKQLKTQCTLYDSTKASGITTPLGPGGVNGATLTGHSCGGGTDAVSTSIDIGCKGKGNPIADATFAIIRVLSDGVGLVIIGSIVVGGIQYSASRGDPQATAIAIGRIRSTVIALLLYIFGYAILNFIIPAGFLH